MLLAFRWAGPAVAAFGARDRVAAAVPVSGPLELPADLDHACVEVDVLPAQPECLALADAEREGDRPAGAVRSVLHRGEDLACLVAGQGLDLDLFADRRVHHRGDVAAGLAPLPRDLECAEEDAVDLQDRVRLEVLSGQLGIERVEVLGLKPVEPALAEPGDDPAAYLR